MFTFTHSNGFHIQVSSEQKKYLTSEEKINAAIGNKDIIAFDIYYNFNLIGFAMFKLFDEHKCFLWDYAIDSDYQNCGYGFKALNELCKYLSNDYDIDTITTTYIDGNNHAKYIYEKIGFKECSVADAEGHKEINMIYKIKSQV